MRPVDCGRPFVFHLLVTPSGPQYWGVLSVKTVDDRIEMVDHVVKTDSLAPVAASDESLVDSLRDGDMNAAEQLVRRYREALVRYLHRLCRSEQLAEELHQQTWLSVLEHIKKFDATAGGGFKAWLFRIATNKANDHWRSSGRERAAKEGLKLVTEDAAPEAGAGLEATEQQEKLRRAIDQLPEAQKQVLLLRYYSNLKFVEIAQVLGCPLNTALGRMHKAMLKLKQLME
jgi:RNA polymerase sigma-70 factor (ECF subfamily)